MKTRFLRLVALGFILFGAVDALAWEVKIVNSSGHELRYEVYQQTLLGEKMKCSGYFVGDFFAGGTCSMDYAYCPTRVNIYVGRNYWKGPFESYQSMESGYLGAQCWNHKVEIKPADPNNKDYNPPMTWEWSYYN